MSKRSLDKDIKLERSRDGHLRNRSGRFASKFCHVIFGCERCKNDNDLHFLCPGLFFKFLICILPICLFFSYYPVISFGGSETMNFELSVPLIWLVAFDLLGFILLCKSKKLFNGSRGKWIWLLFPAWLLLTVLWSLNPTRGVLTVGILWLIYFAGYIMWSFREIFDDDFRAKWLKWFVGSTLVVCMWCVLQCILDLAGVSQGYSLMCDGCTYRMFGFPHPNGFAIEPQFMGNLLLAPAIVVAWFLLLKQNHIKPERERSRDGHFYNGSVGLAPVFQYRLLVRDRCKNDNGSRSLCSGFIWFCFAIITTTLFLTFSRGAIYALVVGMLFVSGFVVFGVRRQKRGELLKRLGILWGVVILSFVMALNMQGVMAELSPTDDDYFDGISRVVNHLSLGVINIRSGNSIDNPEIENTKGELREDTFVVVENIEQKSVENSDGNSDDKAVFDGYVTESTDTRMKLTGAALEVWSKDISTMLFGVGLGGAGQAMYNHGLTASPKEIVQNQYASLLLESGLVGISLFIMTIVLIVRLIWIRDSRIVFLGIIVAYGVSLFFFAGLPNALHIYLLPIVIFMLL